MGRKAAYLIRPREEGKIFKKHPPWYHTFLYLCFPYCDDVLAQIAPVVGMWHEASFPLPSGDGMTVHTEAICRLPSSVEPLRADRWAFSGHSA